MTKATKTERAFFFLATFLFLVVAFSFLFPEKAEPQEPIDFSGPYTEDTTYFLDCLLYEKAKVEAFTFDKLKEGFYEENCFR